MAKHAILSPSSASQWSSCHAAPAMQSGMPDKSGNDAAEGTGMHEAAETVLPTGESIYSYVGKKFNGFELTVESARDLDRGYIQPVWTLAQGGTLFVEQRLSITHITGEEDAYGTSDVVILHGRTLYICDLKWGMGVQVFAKDNKQLCTYALAALREFELIQDFDEVVLMIFQPRLNHIDEWRITVAELYAIGEGLKANARIATLLLEYTQECGKTKLEQDKQEFFAPSDDNCRFCKAKTTCVALRVKVLTTISADFEDLDAIDADALIQAKKEVKDFDIAMLAKLMPMIGLIQAWCKAVIAKGEASIHAGNKIPGYKLVMGKQGNRNWVDPVEVEKVMKALRLKRDEMYTLDIVSPTQAEKLLSDKPKQWEKLRTLIVRKPGQPTVVEEGDKRDEIVIAPPGSEFEDETLGDLA
ncbi:DUF2800 domain-containing protein [Undibacterium sp. Di26W]|uniref:DUF2800 domain-containing protein n=1 Tax=Undibacterium sp. Di26W TaxID=3413035 RepID=UPI003BF0B706